MGEPKTQKKSAPAESDWGSRSHVHTLLLMAVTVAGIYICYLLTVPFFPALAWALAFAVIFAPLNRWLEATVKHPGVAAAICVMIVTVVVIVPVTFVAERIIAEATAGAETIKRMMESGDWRQNFGAHPTLASAAQWVERHFDLQGMVKNATAWLTDNGVSVAWDSLRQLVGVILTFYMFFYFLRDRREALKAIRFLSPLSEPDMNRIFAGVVDTVHATLYGTFAVAIVQGTLGGLMFWWLGLPAPILWGTVMGLLAIVPVLGAFVIWIPAAVFLLLEGSPGKALLLTLWGTVVVGGIDNILYPVLVGKRLQMHTVLAFISIVGGLVVFGASGLILGPVIFTITRLLLEIWSNRDSTTSVIAAQRDKIPDK